MSKRIIAGIGAVLALGLAGICIWLLAHNFLETSKMLQENPNYTGGMDAEGKKMLSILAIISLVMAGVFFWAPFEKPKPKLSYYDPPRPIPPGPPGSMSIEHRPLPEGPGDIIDFRTHRRRENPFEDESDRSA